MTNAERRHINALPKSLKPISTIGYILYTLLYVLGPIGIIASLVHSFTAKNLNLRKFARAALILWIVVVGAVVALFALKVVTVDQIKNLFNK